MVAGNCGQEEMMDRVSLGVIPGAGWRASDIRSVAQEAEADRRLTDLLQIEHPLVLAPMAGFATVELAASVCAAGGLGSIGCATMQPQTATEAIEKLRSLTSRAINLNFFLPQPGAIQFSPRRRVA